MKKVMLFCFLAVVRCGGGRSRDLGPIRYMVSESPLASGYAGACLSRRFTTDYFTPGVRDLKWAIGTDIEVDVSWPDRNDCSSDGYLGPTHCPAVDADFIPLGTNLHGNRSWEFFFMSAKPAPSYGLALRAYTEGEGGFSTLVNGKDVDPTFKLTVGSALAIRFERARGSGFDDVIPGAITEIHAARGDDNVVVAATLRDSSGEHICGAVPATVTVTPIGLFSVESRLQDSHLQDAPYVNLPFRILAGSTPGIGTFELRTRTDLGTTAPEIRGSLNVIVE
jgi:hypothetical protein